MLGAGFVYQHGGNGHKNIIEFCLHGVFKLKFAAANCKVYFGIIGQVDSYGLASCIAVACIVYRIIDIHVGIGSGLFCLVGRIDRESGLKSRKQGIEFLKLCTGQDLLSVRRIHELLYIRRADLHSFLLVPQ